MNQQEKRRIKSPIDRMYRYEVWKLQKQFSLQKPAMKTLAIYMADKWGGEPITHYRRLARIDLEALSKQNKSDFVNETFW